MSTVDWLVTGATIASGTVSGIVIISLLVDAITRGWVRGIVRSWLGIDEVRRANEATQRFILDMGRAYNELVDTVCEEHDISEENRPSYVNTARYQYFVENGDNISEGDFLRSGDD